MTSKLHQAEELYTRYAESEPIDNQEIWAKYQILRTRVAHLSQQEQIAILEAAADLANAQEKAAFLAALTSRS